MEQEIARFEKNASEEVIVKLTNYKGKDLVDIMAYYGDEPKPTPKGITLRIEQIPPLVEALIKAEKIYKESNPEQK